MNKISLKVIEGGTIGIRKFVGVLEINNFLIIIVYNSFGYENSID
jgi:hypothetical protein